MWIQVRFADNYDLCLCYETCWRIFASAILDDLPAAARVAYLDTAEIPREFFEDRSTIWHKPGYRDELLARMEAIQPRSTACPVCG